jgi:hypothetical protein
MMQKMVLNINDEAYKNARKLAKKKGTTVENLAVEFLRKTVKNAEGKPKRKAVRR